MGTEVTHLPAFEKVRRLKKGTCVIGDSDEGVTVPRDISVFIRTLETESGIQILAETITPASFAAAGSEAHAVFRCLAKLYHHNFPSTGE